MGILHGFGPASGFALDDLHFVGARWDPDHENAADQIVARAHPLGYESAISLQSCTDVWRSERGAVYAAAGSRVVWTADGADRAAPWRTFECEVAAGIWGLDDTTVFAFPRGLSTDYYYRFDGATWSRRDAPGVIHRAHGRSSTTIVGVGSPGLIAHWDGSSWSPRPTEVRGVFLDVHVASDDEMYAVHENGQLWEGSVHGWSLRLEAGPGSLSCVAKWKDRVWVGTKDRGLCMLDGSVLVPVKPTIFPRRMDVRRDLVMSQPEKIVGTSDGQSFRGIQTGTLETLFNPIRPRWIP